MNVMNVMIIALCVLLIANSLLKLKNDIKKKNTKDE